MNNTQNHLEEGKNPCNYRVICERCHRTLFYSGPDIGETISVLCDKCTEAMIAPSASTVN